jgi:hypothetical protein
MYEAGTPQIARPALTAIPAEASGRPADRFWDPPFLLSNSCRGVSWPEREADH